MIDTSYLQYIPEDKREQCYKSMVSDIYYFYYGIRPNNNDKIICIDNNKYNLDKNNLKLLSLPK